MEKTKCLLWNSIKASVVVTGNKKSNLIYLALLCNKGDFLNVSQITANNERYLRSQIKENIRRVSNIVLLHARFQIIACLKYASCNYAIRKSTLFLLSDSPSCRAL